MQGRIKASGFLPAVDYFLLVAGLTKSSLFGKLINLRISEISVFF
jgi:hypothetical protein